MSNRFIADAMWSNIEVAQFDAAYDFGQLGHAEAIGTPEEIGQAVAAYLRSLDAKNLTRMGPGTFLEIHIRLIE